MTTNQPAIHPREEGFKKNWTDKKDGIMSVEEAQYSYDTSQREQKFIESQFPTAEEKERYSKYRKEWYRRAKEFDPGPAPLAVTCELVSTCNLACKMCYTVTEEFQRSVIGAQRMLPWKIVKAVIDECAELGVPSMLFSWRGESLMYRSRDGEKNVDFGDVLLYARKKGILEITSLTNGHMLNKKLAEKIIRAEPNWISFSVDGLEQAYNKIRIPKKKQQDFNGFTHVIQNIKTLIRLRNEAGKTRPQIRVNAVYPAIAEDPKAYYEFMKAIGVDWITINELMDMRGEDVPEESIMENWACQYPFQRLTISANGILLPCTGAHNEEPPLIIGRYRNSSNKQVVSENGKTRTIKETEKSIVEAWTSEKTNLIRKLHKEGKRKKINPGCKYCRHGVQKKGAQWVPKEWDMETMEWKGTMWRT
ncbi:radical SAM/SPASM domain-containing protein [Desulfobacter latus]|uniref:Radical SAM protein n=1 Tax=Desulfobacter latus TaxID=2292 RepID=A0A850T7E9_9BACT|nr:radical SAM protein [Desulfobacter latus]NWH04975.1 radical SAM protein [Desulfobacter latus]